ncbi:MAG TPA: 30S ribosomal protein S20 [Candidatus Yonathbacteria bacterium]|nr:30S ribosomal protein S20 [Candidatus Yonathbacteria bacterium]
MPITKGAKKAHRASLKKKVFNDRRKRAMKDAVKNIKNLVTKKDKDSANSSLPTAYKAIDKAAKRGIIKKNTAARKKSRLSKMIAKIS